MPGLAHAAVRHFALALIMAGAATAAELTVGPPQRGACGPDCDTTTVQDAIDLARPGDTIRIYRHIDDLLNSGCYDEHVVIDRPLTLEGAGLARDTAACLRTSTGDTDGVAPTNYGPGVAHHASNVSVDPLFATDLTDETNGGMAPCPADGGDDDDVRCFELYEDNYFPASAAGSCHADVLPDSAGAPVFLDLSGMGEQDQGQPAQSGLGRCVWQPDDHTSPTIDMASGFPLNETAPAGEYANLGAFGMTARASRTHNHLDAQR